MDFGYRHIGAGFPPIHEEERAGLTCDDCNAYHDKKYLALRENYEEVWSGMMFSSVPGGSSVALPGNRRGQGQTAKQHERQFNKGMDAYGANRKAGLKGDSTTTKGVERAYKRAERNERLKKKVESGELEHKGIEFGPALLDEIGVT